jgi:hypothetical protein
MGLVAIDDGAQRELRLPWYADLADEKQIKRCAQRVCDLDGDRDAAAWQRKDNRLCTFQVLQPRGELPARIGSVLEKLSAHNASLSGVRSAPSARL